MYLVDVVLPVPLFKTFSYLSEKPILPGQRVCVYLKTNKVIGIAKKCEKIEDSEKLPPLELKNIEEVIDDAPILPKTLIEFLDWVSEYYICPIGIVYKTALPPQTFVFSQKRLKLTEKGILALKKNELPKEFQVLEKKSYTFKYFLKKANLTEAKLRNFIKKGFLALESEIPEIKIPTERFVKIKENPPSISEDLSTKEKEVITFIEKHGEVLETILKKFFSSRVIKKLYQKGILEVVEYPKTRKISFSPNIPLDYKLTPSQEKVWKDMEKLLGKKEFSPILLFGVTGSGKSFIYLSAIKKILSLKKRVLVLVPEIALTTYIEALVFHYFKESIGVLHSGLSPKERYAEWWRILKGEVNIVIGTRSAIFAPIENLGLIIVDEEHDPSYKEERLQCKYHARDLAIKRAKQENIPVILGSATPSIKTYYFAKTKKYYLFTLKERPFVRLPEIKLINHEGFKLFSTQIKQEIQKVLEKGNSVFLYLNRRGYAPIVKCKECGHIWMCPNCGISLTYHKDENVLLCHHCNFKIYSFRICPNCEGTSIKLLRAGTQRIEEEVKKEFPDVEVFRFDRDVINTKKKLMELLEKLYKDTPKIIIGTQMGIHGHNFPHVELVAVLRAEEGLFLPDYKAGERVFQVLIQACGRAGREGEQGKVILQTFLSEHYVLNYVISQDYEGFFEKELELRKIYGFPPFNRLARIKVEGLKEEKVKELILKIYSFIMQKKPEELDVLGPSPCPFKKLKNRYRWHIILRSKRYTIFARLIKDIIARFQKPGLKVIWDIDPEDMLQ